MKINIDEKLPKRMILLQYLLIEEVNFVHKITGEKHYTNLSIYNEYLKVPLGFTEVENNSVQKSFKQSYESLCVN